MRERSALSPRESRAVLTPIPPSQYRRLLLDAFCDSVNRSRVTREAKAA